MKTISIYLAGALMIVTGMLGAGIGYTFTPEYQLSMYDKNAMDLGQADRWVDKRYINAMIAHHRGAMLLAQAAQKSERQEIRDLANEILQNEPKLIAELYTWKKEWYNDERTVRDPLSPNLGSVNDTFDLRFLNALIAHHENGIRMTGEIRGKSSRTEILDNADAVENFLTTTGEVLRGWRTDWYSV
jgi:predicted outer membrane protein